jgi:NADH:ubiquinone oxidoreductase subunit 5 (subunit L)/multisubunit Na+/H+ antiporter MnhA subunit
MQAGRFFAQLMGFSGAMLALVTAGNLLTLFISWELTSIISFLLIGFKGSDEKARTGALQALMVTGGGGLALLVGVLLLGAAAGTMDMAIILRGAGLQDHAWYSAIAVLMFIGAFSKSAQWPLHFWLPQAMSAPTPASAFLHSATMVKAGIYLLARMYPVLGNTPLWNTALPVFGLITMLVGAVLALRQRDLKGNLAFSTVSQLGALVALVGLPESVGIKAAMVGIAAHALYKGALFLVAGAVDHATGTRNLDKLSGLRRIMPGFALTAALAGLSMAGVPPLLGFVGKELLLDAALHTDMLIGTAIVVVSAALTVTMALILFWDVFMGDLPEGLPQDEHIEHIHHPYGDDAYDVSHYHELPRPMVWGPLSLAVLSLVLGMGVGPLMTPVIQPAVGKPISLYLFPPEGINTAFVLSALALLAGGLIFMARRIWLAWPQPALPSGSQIYRGIVSGVEALADLLLRSQNGRIRHYLIVILLAVIALMITTIPATRMDVSGLTLTVRSAADGLKAVLIALALGATLASIIFKRHLLAALSLGVGGYAIGGLFLLEPAPDVALVQFLVETLATVLIIMILVRTSDTERAKVIENLWGGSRFGFWRDIAIAVVVGVGVTVFALAAVSSRPGRQSVAEWHLENALPQTGVTDVVAAIITDFRAMDTLIEIAVFGMAALGVLTLLAQRHGSGRSIGAALRDLRRKSGESEKPAEPPVEDESPVVYEFTFSDPLNRFAARVVLPTALLLSVAHILYAGAAPGDGFTAGVISGLAVALWYIVFGYERVRLRLRWLRPARIIGLGLTLALVNGALPMFFGREFLASTLLPFSLPASIKLASATVFEIGIFLTVLGGISAIMEAITHPKEVEQV